LHPEKVSITRILTYSLNDVRKCTFLVKQSAVPLFYLKGDCLNGSLLFPPDFKHASFFATRVQNFIKRA